MDDLTLDDPTNIGGMSHLLNVEDIDDFNPQELEQRIMAGSSQMRKPINIVQDFAIDIENLTQAFNIPKSESNYDFDLASITKTSNSSASINESSFNINDDLSSDFLLNEDYSNLTMDAPIQDVKLQNMTNEEKRRNVIESAMSTMVSSSGLNIEREREDEEKAIILEEIDSLREMLEIEGDNLEKVPKVDVNSSLKDIEFVHQTLVRKNDRKRYSSLAEECFIGLAQGVEWFFDGKTTYFGKYKPDMTDWHRTVQTKLRRMRHDTSQVVKSIMQDLGFNSLMRIVVELLPSAIYYSNQRKSQYKDTITRDISEGEWDSSLNKIRDTDNKGF
jgi:hypothetical protein